MEKSTIEPLPNHAGYFPINRQQTFRIKTITIDAPLNLFDTIEYTYTISVDTVIQNNGETTGFYTIEYHNVNRPSERLVREIIFPVGAFTETYDNCKIIKCPLPIPQLQTWDSRIFCSENQKNQRSRVLKAHFPIQFENKTIDSALLISHKYDSSLIHLKSHSELYGIPYGLLYSEKIDILSNSPNLDFTIPIRERIEIGTITTIEQIFE